MDRLFSLLQNSPNSTLRSAAAKQLGEIAKKSPECVDILFSRLRNLLWHKSWTSRTAAAEAIRAIVHNLPVWEPVVSMTSKSYSSSNEDGFLSLSTLCLSKVLSQGVRLYSVDMHDLSRSSSEKNGVHSDPSGCFCFSPPVPRLFLNKRLGLGDADVNLSALGPDPASDILETCLSPADFLEQGSPTSSCDLTDVETCIRSTLKRRGETQ
ncbi:unnamed protein product [Protopolystoma xenopodis]|uniref:Uncharacterized protein n=1 Tax=Protopolystoma xenopodis TaxID=117903 RepID=A0A448XJF4_9PLAT|nr:unnamed protein product [Protopolystoma xenopodis]